MTNQVEFLRALQVVPWRDEDEWRAVVEALLQAMREGLEVSQARDFALGRISAWTSRWGKDVPLSVSCTKDFLQCQAMEAAGFEREQLILAYGTAIVRFVNLLSEQPHERLATPITELAANIGIPSWMVILRHDVTHRCMPSLNTCHHGCRFALSWLSRNFWLQPLQVTNKCDDKGQMSVSEESDTPWDAIPLDDQTGHRLPLNVDGEDMVMNVLIEYEQRRYKDLLIDGAATSRSADTLLWLDSALSPLLASHSEIFIKVLTDDGFMIPTAAQLDALGLEYDTNSTFPCEDLPPPLPETLLLLWRPLLCQLSRAGLLANLLCALIARSGTAKHKDLRWRNTTAWTLALLDGKVLPGNVTKWLVNEHLKHKGNTKYHKKKRQLAKRQTLRCLMVACLDWPNLIMPQLLERIFHIFPNPTNDYAARLIRHLASVYVGQFVEWHDENSDIVHQDSNSGIYTVNDLFPEEKLTPAPDPVKLASIAKALEGSPWQLCTDPELLQCPLGKVPRQSSEPNALMLSHWTKVKLSEFKECVPAAKVDVLSRSVQPVPNLVQLKSSLTLF
uniref:ribosomal biogenesis protein LAS1L-like isoform X2 n=1 Tax=Myxine glutinosa TaxID=7769 RepID=UPI00358ED9CD